MNGLQKGVLVAGGYRDRRCHCGSGGVRKSRLFFVPGEVGPSHGWVSGAGPGSCAAAPQCRGSCCHLHEDRKPAPGGRGRTGAHGGEVMGIPCDVRDRNEVRSLVNQVVGRWGGVDILINNAGIIEVGPLDAMSVEDFHRSMETHCSGRCIRCSKVPSMRRRGWGRIVNIASLGGKRAVPHMLPYAAASCWWAYQTGCGPSWRWRIFWLPPFALRSCVPAARGMHPSKDNIARSTPGSASETLSPWFP